MSESSYTAEDWDMSIRLREREVARTLAELDRARMEAREAVKRHLTAERELARTHGMRLQWESGS